MDKDRICPYAVRGIAAILAVFLVCFATACRPRTPESQAKRESAKATQLVSESGETRIPGFTLKDTTGRRVSSEEFRGKALLVDFWATWCAPCKKEMPGFEQLQKQYRDRGVAVIGIALDSDPQQVAKFARDLGVTYTLLIGDSEVMKKWEILGIPTTFLIDRRGVIRHKVVGFEYKEVLETALKEIL